MFSDSAHRDSDDDSSRHEEFLAHLISGEGEWATGPARPLSILVDTVALATDTAYFIVELALPIGPPPSRPFVLLADEVSDHLASLDRSDLEAADGATLVGDLLLIEQIECYLQAAKVQRLALLTRPGTAGDPTAMVERRLSENSMLAGLSAEQIQVVRDGETVLAAEQLAVAQVGAAMVVAPGTAARRVHEALDLVENLPGTLAALGAGQVDQQRARILADRSRVLSGELRRELEDRLLAVAPTCTPRQWRNRVDAEVIALDPDAAELRRRDAVDRRKLRLDKLDDGIGRFLADLPAHQAQLAWDLFDAVAEQLRGLDDRTADQRRADAFVTIVEMLASGQTVTVAGILAHPDLTRHDACHRPAHPADLIPDDLDCDSACTAAAATTAEADGVDPNPPTDLTDMTAETDGVDSSPATDEADGTVETDVFDLSLEPDVVDLNAAEAPDHSAGCNDQLSDPEGSDAAFGDHRPRVAAAQSRERSRVACDETPPAVGHQPQEPEPVCARTGCGCGQWKLPTRQGRNTHTTVAMTLDALAGLLQDPAQLAGHGTITAEYARALAESARSLNVQVVDDDGKVVGIGERRYRPRQSLRDQVTTAYPTCVFTGCHRSVDRSDLDHIEPFALEHPGGGGPTAFANLGPLCRHHHRLKTFGGWSYRPAGSVGNPLRGGSSIPAAHIFRSPLGLESVSRVDHIVRPHRDVPPPF